MANRFEHHGFNPYDVSALEAPGLAKEFEAEDALGDDQSAAIWITGDDRLLSGVRHIIVPGCSDGLQRRIRGVSRLIDQAEIDVDSISGVNHDSDAWIIIAVSDNSDAATLVDLLGMVFAEISGGKVVAMVNAYQVCDHVREASGGLLDADIDPLHAVVIAAAAEDSENDEERFD